MPLNQQAVGDLIEIAGEAGRKTMEIYESGDFSIEAKSDNSPLTEADKAANDIIVSGLKKVDPAIPIISEELAAVDYQTRKAWPKYWLVDPLDGTKEFITRTGDFTINIALIVNNHPQFGVVYSPVLGEMYFALKDKGAYLQKDDITLKELKVRECDDNKATTLVSRSHQGKESEVLHSLFPNLELTPMGSSLKFCHIAAGKADFYVRSKPTSEWDTGAAHCVLEAAGGQLLNFSGSSLAYNKEDILNPSFIAVGDPMFDWQRVVKAFS